MPPLIRLVHPAPASAVIALSAALAAILAMDAGRPALDGRVVLVALSVAGSQILAGALNDWADRERDARVQPHKPIPTGLVSSRAALVLAGIGAALLVGASAPLGVVPLLLGLIAGGSAVAYDLWLSRTPLSVLPYLISFGILPVWIATGVGMPPGRVAEAIVLVGPFAAAAHLANTLRDFDADRAVGSRNLAQVLGRDRAQALAVALALAVGIGAGVLLVGSGRLEPASAVLGGIGLLAVGAGFAGPRWLWVGMLVAAVCWTVAWAVASI
ncbi:MAG: UbiA family prenyltransferase [Candidatus Limnocylindria bacterium]